MSNPEKGGPQPDQPESGSEKTEKRDSPQREFMNNLAGRMREIPDTQGKLVREISHVMNDEKFLEEIDQAEYLMHLVEKFNPWGFYRPSDGTEEDFIKQLDLYGTEIEALARPTVGEELFEKIEISRKLEAIKQRAVEKFKELAEKEKKEFE
jgi:hypothetical protein